MKRKQVQRTGNTANFSISINFSKMKKKISFLIGMGAMLISIPAALAATIASDASVQFSTNSDPQLIRPITVTAGGAGEITAADGISITIPDALYTIWDRSVVKVQVSGSAVTNGKIAANAEVLHPDPFEKMVTVKVLSDFSAGETAVINGLVMRVYDTANTPKFLEYDLNADDVTDVYDINGIKLDDTDPKTDNMAPYDVSGLKAEQVSTSEVKLAWTNPPDLDIKKIEIEKTQVRNGVTSTITYDYIANYNTIAILQEYIDTVQLGDKVTYAVYVRDSRNRSAGTTVGLTIVTNPQPSSTQQSTSPTQQTAPGSTQQTTTTPLAGEAIQGIILTTRVDKTLAWGTWLRLWYVDTVTKNIAPYGKYKIEYMLKGDGHKGQILQQYGPTGRSNARATFKCDPEGIYSINIVDLTTNKLVWAGDKSCLK